MVEELKQELRKVQNLIGYEGKLDVTSRRCTEKLIYALRSKYKEDLTNTLRLHRLELFYDLVNSNKKKTQKSVEEKFVLSKKREKEDADEEDEEDQAEEAKETFQDDVITVRPEDVDNWRDLMTLSKVYYHLEHPNSQGLTWKRRVKKKKQIKKLSDKDLIEWRAEQLFRLKTLEEWAVSKTEERKLAEKSPHNFDDLLQDEETRELEDLFQILDSQEQKKPKKTKLAKIMRTKRPFKFQDECMEDWTESYSDDSEESGADDAEDDTIIIAEDEDFKVPEIHKDSTLDEQVIISEMFSSYKELKPYRNPDFEEMYKTKSMAEWYDLCSDALGKRDSPPKFVFTEDDDEKQRVVEVITVEDIPNSKREIKRRNGTSSRVPSLAVQQEAKQTLKKILSEAEGVADASKLTEFDSTDKSQKDVEEVMKESLQQIEEKKNLEGEVESGVSKESIDEVTPEKIKSAEFPPTYHQLKEEITISDDPFETDVSQVKNPKESFVSKVATTIDSLEQMQQGEMTEVIREIEDSEQDSKEREHGEISQISPVPFNIAEKALQNQTFTDIDGEIITEREENEMFFQTGRDEKRNESITADSLVQETPENKQLSESHDITSSEISLKLFEDETVEKRLRDGRSDIYDISKRRNFQEQDENSQPSTSKSIPNTVRQSIGQIIQKSKSSFISPIKSSDYENKSTDQILGEIVKSKFFELTGNQKGKQEMSETIRADNINSSTFAENSEDDNKEETKTVGGLVNQLILKGRDSLIDDAIHEEVDRYLKGTSESNLDKSKKSDN